MSLWICVRSIKDDNRELSIYRSGGSYRVKYKSGNQATELKGNISDIGYANYLFDRYAKDLHMEESLIENEDIYNVDFFKERIDKYSTSLIKNNGGNNRVRVNRRSSDVCQLIELQSKILDILSKDYGEFKIVDIKLDDFIRNQKRLRYMLGDNDYSKTSYGSKLNKYFKTIDSLIFEKFNAKLDKDTVKMLDEEIKKVKRQIRDEVKILLNCYER